MPHVLLAAAGPSLIQTLVHEFASSGWRVSVLADDEPDQSWQLLDPARRGSWQRLDASEDSAAIARAVAAAHSRTPLSGLVFVPRTQVGSVSLLDGAHRERLADVALEGARDVELCAAFADCMIQSRSPGSIVAVLSLASSGYAAREGWAEHIAAGGSRGLVLAAAGELAQHSIRVNAVARGGGATDHALFPELGGETRSRIPLGRGVEDRDVARVAEWLISPASSLVTGHIVPVDGGELALAVPPVGAYPLRVAGEMDA